MQRGLGVRGCDCNEGILESGDCEYNEGLEPEVPEPPSQWLAFVAGLSGPASTHVQWTCDDHGLITASYMWRTTRLVVHRSSRCDAATGAILVNDYKGGFIAIETWAAEIIADLAAPAPSSQRKNRKKR